MFIKVPNPNILSTIKKTQITTRLINKKGVYKHMVGSIIEKHSKYFFTASFVLIIILSIYLIKSYIVTIVGATLLAYIFYPLYKLLKKTIKNSSLASLLTTILIILIIIIPIIFAANALVGESILFFQKTKDIDLSNIEEKISEYTSDKLEISEYVQDSLNKFSLYIAKETSDFLFSLPKKILHLFILLFLMYYLFIEGNCLIKRIKDHIPLKESHKRNLTERFNSTIYASLYGLVVTAFVQGAIGALGLWIFGVQSPIFWGLVMIILSMLPFVGATLVWLPAAVYKLMVGEIFNGVGLLLYGILIVSTIDNIIRPKIIGTKGKIHPALVLLGVLGGIEIFGLFGIIIGPLILAILTVFLELYILEKHPKHRY